MDRPQVSEARTEFEEKATAGARSLECDRLRPPDLRTVSALSAPRAAAAVTPTSPAAAVRGSCCRIECTGRPRHPLPTLQSCSPRRGGGSPLSAHPLGLNVTPPQVS